MRTEADLTPDQREAIEFAWRNPFSALFLDVGFGKTVITLTVLRRLIQRGYRGKILVIAPIRVATRVWPYEIKLWTHLASMRAVVIRVEDADSRLLALPYKHRTEEKHRLRRALLDSPDQIHIINQEAVDWIVAECKARKKWPYKVVIFDESSRLRDHKSVVFKALKKVRPHIQRFHELTATPASQTYMHLFSQIYLLDKGERFGKGITAFRERYFDYNPYARTYKIKDGAAQEIERLISDICLVMRRKRDFQVNIRSIRLSSGLLDDYAEFERELVLELPNDKVIDAINGAVLCSKLLQYASGFVYDGAKVCHEVHDEKIEELKSLADETLDEPILVAYWFKATLNRLRRAFPKAVVMDREGKMEESWNKRQHKMMLVHPQSVAHGMNLQAGGHHLALVDMFYSLELFTQLIGRLDRPGQAHQVMVHLLCAQDTIDETVAQNLRHLRSAEESMFQRLREIKDEFLPSYTRTGRPGDVLQIPRGDLSVGVGAIDMGDSARQSGDRRSVFERALQQVRAGQGA